MRNHVTWLTLQEGSDVKSLYKSRCCQSYVNGERKSLSSKVAVVTSAIAVKQLSKNLCKARKPSSWVRAHLAVGPRAADSARITSLLSPLVLTPLGLSQPLLPRLITKCYVLKVPSSLFVWLNVFTRVGTFLEILWDLVLTEWLTWEKKKSERHFVLCYSFSVWVQAEVVITIG